jgi:hypothetical protein
MTAVSVSDLATDAVPFGADPTIPPARRIVGALTLPALFLALLATGPLDPLDDNGSTAEQLRQAAGQLARLQTLALVEVAASILLVGVVLAFAGRTRGRGQVLGNIGVALGVPGALAMALIALHHVLLGVLATQTLAVGTQVLAGLDAAVIPLLLLMMFCGPISLAVLAGAGLRAGFVPLPAFVFAMLFGITDWIPALAGGELIPLLFGLVGFGWTAVVLLRTRR